MSQNPFNPSFDYNKSSFISDNHVLNNIIDAIDNENSKWRTTFILGMRGAGKTSLLTYISRQLNTRKNVIHLSLTSADELLGNIVAGLQQKLPQLPEFKTASISLPGIKVDITKPTTRSTFQFDVENLLNIAKFMGITVVLLLDEVQNKTAQLRTLFAAYKTYRGADLPIMLISAGLPSAVDAIINDTALTFLLRANQVKLAPLEQPAITQSYIQLFKGRGLSAQQAVRMSQSSMGYPYMYQLLGDYIWENGSNPVQENELTDAIYIAKQALFQNVYAKVISDLAPKDRELVLAIQSQGGKNVTTEMLREATGWDTNNLTTHKAMLNHWGVTAKSGYGLISFILPYFSEFLTEYFD
ncbi:hypothetical protein EQG49_04455 [Periweissella cryptocerci]|uniref:ATP-binding protein n=1 Tax=Periweissella cryptocerci TaxID=2506420 RepID=A0A4P6YSX1_9LACO|nr:hypothetical protein [Periweissella cryptocerci]QBO35766.1 hypothetical protein EQG49_04455 [Periweissella cryptocerci]